MNMYKIVKEQEGKTFPSYPYYLDVCELDDKEYIIQTHPTDPKCGVMWRRMENGYDDTCAYRYPMVWDWVITDEQGVLAEAIRDARRWLTLEKGGWKQ